ncbi:MULTISPECIES: 2-C-methyl-D-erythritol 4-phosphate cytidylyltransferase [unclassified Frigoribacterium]|uniref:2-C-methyl-D-erythritol 4-phosphate cytidylyltransferase n=1 Tax=unclassified Frigoribacterium TaxID=2627005 RepID=UPI0007000506|nr:MULTISPECIES: 2-C-methyl-D-erythritol 4-phosphate cytidylyltransferase [unclassified Frigoribacterium]KQM29225.1 2-C-methyl-D-erythritol 2,4-cyclodiphosphate synthase [Frigoribacterium sp. Leaf8]WAC52548.1 2-C-methyl-D-erythritol 4-phosphate cytidylyltransferase [Frigoribacterium sp. SL97]
MRPSTPDDRSVDDGGVHTPFAAGRAVVVVAAGSGTRLALGKPKAFVEVAGRSILERSLDAVFASAVPTQVVVVVPEALVDESRTLVDALAGPARDYASVVVGGATRQQSVAAGLTALGPDVETVLVHDCARPFTPTAQFDLVATTVEASGDGVVPGLPVTDTIKRVDSDAAFVVDTVDRSELVAMQTPQGFPRAALDHAYATASVEHTDDAALFAAAGHRVRVVAGDPVAFKITTPWDLRRAETIVAETEATRPGPEASGGPAPRLLTGVGTDVHAFDAAQPMHLGLLHFPGEAGLAGHSDGDAVAHAIVDALLSAAGLGDIGSSFGTDDPRFAGASGDVFLTATLELLAAAGAAPVNVAVQVVGNRPRLSSRRVEMQAGLTRVVGAPVSVSATTTDGLGFTGRGEGVAVIATALVTHDGSSTRHGASPGDATEAASNRLIT